MRGSWNTPVVPDDAGCLDLFILVSPAVLDTAECNRLRRWTHPLTGFPQSRIWTVDNHARRTVVCLSHLGKLRIWLVPIPRVGEKRDCRCWCRIVTFYCCWLLFLFCCNNNNNWFLHFFFSNYVLKINAIPHVLCRFLLKFTVSACIQREREKSLS